MMRQSRVIVAALLCAAAFVPARADNAICGQRQTSLRFNWPNNSALVSIERELSPQDDKLIRERFDLPDRGRSSRDLLTRRISATAPAAGGYLIGTDEGEWSGGLYFVDGGRHVSLSSDNVQGLVTIGSKHYAIVGYAHMVFNSGSLLLIDFVDGAPRISRTISLPSRVEGYAVKGGRIFLYGCDYRQIQVVPWAQIFDPPIGFLWAKVSPP